MAATASIKVTKSFTYKGALKTFSNRYHIDTHPADNAAWTALSDAVVTAEKALYDTNTTIVGTTGYGPGTDIPEFSKTYSTAGTVTATGGRQAPGDSVAVIRYTTTQRTGKNHPIYLFNYYHGVLRSDTATALQFNNVLPAQLTALGTYGSSWVTGFTAAGVTYKRAGPNGAVAQGALAEPLITHRDFPR